MIDDGEANLAGRSEFVVFRDISSKYDHEAQRLERRAECAREALQLDEIWEASTMGDMVNDAAGKFGHTYVASSKIGPRINGEYKPKLPLRLGARVRDIFIAGDGEHDLQVVRGQLLMHRSLDENERIVEKGFFVLLTKRESSLSPTLSFGRTIQDEPDPFESERYSQEQLILELLLSGDMDSYYLLRGLRPRDPAEYRSRLQAFSPIAALNALEEVARRVSRTTGKPWQDHYGEFTDLESDASKQLSLIESLLTENRTRRVFRRDISEIGLLKQNEDVYVPGQELSTLQNALQQFFNDTHRPMQTRPDQRDAALEDLEFGTQMEKLKTLGVTEIDIAHSVVKHRRRSSQAIPTTIRKLDFSEIPFSFSNQLNPTLERYPEIKAYIEHLFKDYAKGPENGDDMSSFFESSIYEINKMQLYKGEGAGGMFGIPYDTHARIMKDLARLHIQPSPEAYPYD